MINSILEIGSTEGNALLINLDNKVGAIGFTGVVEPQWLIDMILPNAIVKVDSVTGELVRDKETGNIGGRMPFRYRCCGSFLFLSF